MVDPVRLLALLVVAIGLVVPSAHAQDEIQFWWEGQLRTGAPLDQYQLQQLVVFPNTSAEARLALQEIGVDDFVYYPWGGAEFGYFVRETASGTPPIGGSTGELISALATTQAGQDLFWSTEFVSDCLGIMPWPYVRVDLVTGTSPGQVHNLAGQHNSAIYGWIDTDSVVLRPATRSVFELAETALALHDSPLATNATMLANWTTCWCGCPSGDPTGGGGPTLPPATGVPSPLEIPTLGRIGSLLLGALLLAFGVARLRA